MPKAILDYIKHLMSYTGIYVLALLIIAAMMAASYGIADHIISLQTHDAKIINMSGRQRMLSQRIALMTAKMTLPSYREEARSDLRQAAEEMKAAHMILTQEKNDMGLTGHLSDKMRSLYFDKTIRSPHHNEEVRFSLDNAVLHYYEEAQAILVLPDRDLTMQNALVKHVMNDYHDRILDGFNKAVMQYELESEQKIEQLRQTELLLMSASLLVLLLVAITIFRPLISRIEKRNTKLELANQSLKQQHNTEKLAALGELSGGLAHEINNALVPAIGMSDILKRKLKDQPDMIKLIDVIYESSIHARKIVQNVLAFARGQDAQNEISNASDIFTEAIELNREIIAPNIELKIWGLADISDAFIYANRTATIQVMANLLKNASEAMADGGTIGVDFKIEHINSERSIEFNLTECDYLVVDVTDSGSGMSETTLKQIFDPFFTTKDIDEGTGLGLSTVYGIMQNLGGAIVANSTQGEGSTFSLYFPLTDPAIFKPVTERAKAA